MAAADSGGLPISAAADIQPGEGRVKERGNRGRFEARMEGIRDSLAAISHGFAGILMNFRPTPPFCRGLTVPFPRIGVRGWRWGSRLCAVDISRWGWKWKYFAPVLSPLFGEGVPSFRSIVF